MAELDDKVIVTKNKITTIADTIREEGGTSDLMTLDEMPDNIRAIAGGGSADVKRLGITLANNTATFNLNGYEIWQLIGSNKTIVADITYTDGNNSTSYNKSCTASLKSEASDTQTRIEASVMIYKNYTFYTRYFNMVIGASSMEYTGTYAVTDIEIPQGQYVDPLFTLTYPNTITCNKTFEQIISYYGAGNTRPVAPQLIYKHSSGDDTAFRSVYGKVEQYDEDTFIFTFNMGFARGIDKTQWQDRIIEIEYASGNLLTKIADYTLEYQKPVVAGDGIELENVGTGINRKTQISVADALMIIGESSGSVASFDDGGNDMPLKSCMVYIEPVQSGSGDPSPQNERPITGWTEANVSLNEINQWDEQWEVGSFNMNTGEKTQDNNLIRSKNFIPILPTNNYYLKIWYSIYNTGFSVLFYDKDKNFISSLKKWNPNLSTSEIPSESRYMMFKTDSIRATYENDISINYPSTDTDYHAYKGNTYNIEFPSQAGTVYGGTLDVINGVLTVTYNYTDMGGLSWTYHPASGQYSDYFDTNLPNDSIYGQAAVPANIMFERYKAIPSGQIAVAPYDNGVMALANGSRRLIVCDQNYTSASALETALSGKPIVYELATPITYQLTPTEIKTLLGINNIFADCGDVDVEYVRDATSIINWLISQINLGA